jgi:hypothetical protein
MLGWIFGIAVAALVFAGCWWMGTPDRNFEGIGDGN